MKTRRCHPERSEGDEASQCGRLFCREPSNGSFAALRITAVLLVIVELAACTSPEAGRTRGGGPGADVKNWNHPVELHAGAEPYHETPCVTEPVECNGPPPVFGPTPPPD
jgi:hypothetical protein